MGLVGEVRRGRRLPSDLLSDLSLMLGLILASRRLGLAERSAREGDQPRAQAAARSAWAAPQSELSKSKGVFFPSRLGLREITKLLRKQ
jgi:hypothetical protein